MVITRHGRDYQEDIAITADIAAVEAANNAAAATTMMDSSHAGDLFGGGGGGESNADDIESEIVDFAASIDIDEEGVGGGGDISAGDDCNDQEDGDGGEVAFGTGG